MTSFFYKLGKGLNENLSVPQYMYMPICMDMALKHDFWLHCCYTNTQACCSKTSYFTPWFFTIATSSRAYPTHIHQWCRAMEVRKHKWIKRPVRESRITIFYLSGPFKPICRKNCKEYSSNANEKKVKSTVQMYLSRFFSFFPPHAITVQRLHSITRLF